MNNLKFIIISKGDYNSAIKKINNYLGEYDNSYIRIDIKNLREIISDGFDYNKDGLFDKIEEDLVKNVLLSGYNVILIAIDKPDIYYRKYEKMIKGYNHLINVKLEYKEIKKKENIFKILKRKIKEI